jgi:flagellar M-ring protein FliF
VTKLPLWQQPEVQDLARSLAWPVGTLLLGGLVLMGLVRPASRRWRRHPWPGRGRNVRAVNSTLWWRTTRAAKIAHPECAQGAGWPDPGELRLEDARKLTRDNPAAVANIVKAWMNAVRHRPDVLSARSTPCLKTDCRTLPFC